MKLISASLLSSALLVLTACGGNADSSDASSAADDFAARINGAGGSAQPAGAPPTVAQALPGAAPGAFAAGTMTDPESAICGANMMGPFIGRVADIQTRIDIEALTGKAGDIRFLRPGGEFVRPDVTNPRLNIMLDNQDVIRDARCG